MASKRSALVYIFNTLWTVESVQEIHCSLHSAWCENVTSGNHTLPARKQEQVNPEVDLVK